jgi:flagellar hook assembly protein FlgD
LTEIVDQARLAIYTVAGRKVFEDDLGTFAGYNQYRWNGRDSAGDRLASGTYLYKVNVKSARGEREFVGRLVKIE